MAANIPLTTTAALAASLGLASHWAWFMHGEHDFLVLRYICGFVVFQATSVFALVRVAELSLASSFGTLFVATTSFFAAISASILVYRLFFHPLRSFPGPLPWRISKWAQAVANADSKGYLHVHELHERYGPVVRTGPSELSIADPAAVTKVLGPGTKCIKSVWYDVGQPLISMHQCRDKKQHDIRRRAWDRGFNAKALRDYESRVATYADVLMEQFREFGGKALNASKWFNYYSFDVMGDLAFGESFHMLDSGKQHFAIPLLEAGMSPMNFIPAVPWFFYILAQLPVISDACLKFIAWSGEQVERRKKMDVKVPDIMTHLLDAPPMSNDDFTNKNWEVGDSRLIIVAGSDTTAATLTYCAYELIKNPTVMAKLRKELSEVMQDGQVLRLHPPVPSGLIRIAPEEGVQIGDTFVPPKTNIIIPLYTIQRSPEAFQYPDEFIPERWTTSPELVKQKAAFAPFSIGAFSCVGKHLAYMELRTVFAKLLIEFEIGFAPGEDGKSFIADTEDHFTLKLADLNIVCTPRKG